ncbi:hypothetical protein T492DRAFT_859313 [Pavlovales sp. CCMP2436]|nr:hypothetical protein T492DRAFT_859313 [Pavlovales sp. CCMP2436]
MVDLAEVSTKNQLLREIERSLSKADLPIIVELSPETNTQELTLRIKASSIKYERAIMDADQILRNFTVKYASDGSASEAEKKQIEADLTRYSELIYTTGKFMLDQIAADMQVKVGELRSKCDASKYDSFSEYKSSLWNKSAACALGVLNEQIADDAMRSLQMQSSVSLKVALNLVNDARVAAEAVFMNESIERLAVLNASTS